MNTVEFAFIDRLIREVHAFQQWESGKEVNQRDFEYLIESIYLKTQGRVSLSTIKRIWNHQNEYLPRVSTLDILCQYLDYEGWSHYKNSKEDAKPTFKKKIDRQPRPTRETKHRIRSSVFMLILAVVLILVGKTIFSGRSDQNMGDVEFSLSKIVGAEVPVTVVFNYDISRVHFDSAFIQLSWNKRERHRISSEENLLTSMYYYPGIHEAKLIINDSIVRTQPVYIEDPRWLTVYRSEPEDVVPVYIESDEVIRNGIIHANPQMLTDFKADTNKQSYFVSYFKVADFGVEADNFTFKTRFRNPTTRGQFFCQNSAIYIYAERGGIYLTLTKPGCTGSSGLMVGDKIISGRRNDLSSLGRDYSQWQQLSAVVRDKKLELYLNDTLSFQTTYEQKMGKILTWQYFFMGHGAVDYLILESSSGEVVYKEDF